MFRRPFRRRSAIAGASFDKPVFAQPYCPLEVLAERTGVQATESLFVEVPDVGKTAAALVRFLRDGEGERALKKAAHILIEERMRCMAVTLDDPRNTGLDRLNVDPRPTPLDAHCARELGKAAGFDAAAGLSSRGWALRLPIKDRIALRFRTAAAAVFVMWRALSILVRRGARSVEPHRTTALVANFWGADQFECLAEAVRDAGFATDRRITLLIERRQPLPRHGFAHLHPESLRVPARPWIVEALGPTWRLALAALPGVLRLRDESVWAAFESLRIASGALEVWPVALNVRCETVSDVIDYLPAISVKSAIYRKIGAKLVRWPATQIDTYGSLLSNLPYDYFVSSGNYLPHAFSRNWRVPEGARPIGLVPCDKRLASATRVDPDFLRRIGELKKNRKLLAYFGHSPETGVTPMIVSTLRAVIDVLDANPDWFLVVKSKRRLVDRKKGRTAYMDIVAAMPEFPRWADDERIVFVDYADEAREICPSGWLVGAMDMGTGDHGSLVGECVARSRPYCSYAPIVYDTPFKEMLLEAEILVTDIERFKLRLTEALKGNIPRLPDEWARWAFDPYQDDRALERLAAVILDNGRIPDCAAGSPPGQG